MSRTTFADLDAHAATLAPSKARHLTIADAMPPADGRWHFSRILATARYKGWVMVSFDWTVEDEDGFEHDAEVIVLLDGYIPETHDRWDEPGTAAYFENTRVFIQETPVGDELGCPPCTSEYFVELVECDANRAYFAELRDAGEKLALDGMR